MLSALAALILCAGLVVPADVPVGNYSAIYVVDVPDTEILGANVIVWPEAEVLPVKTWRGEPLLLFRPQQPGKYLLYVDLPTLPGLKTILDVKGTPGPTPPTPPNPQPAQRCEVLIIYESSELSAMPDEQRRLFSSKQLREQLIKEYNLQFHGFMDVDVTKDYSGPWVTWLEAAKNYKPPLLLLFRGRGIEVYQFPANEKEMREILSGKQGRRPVSIRPAVRTHTSRNWAPAYYPFGCQYGVCP